MASVRDHYENHLAPYYAWICGGVARNLEENRNFFKAHDIQLLDTGRAFDLGAGCGFQSIPLAELGFRVVAMDLSARLLAELKNNAPHLPIETICGDITHFGTYVRDTVDLVVCMGDTLTHLAALESVAALIRQANAALVPGGHLILSFRNLTPARVGLDRFIPVRSNDTTIFTCFLEYEKNTVQVHDIVYEKKGGQWVLHKSAYQKLIVSPEWTRNTLQQAEFKTELVNEKNGVLTIIARKHESRCFVESEISFVSDARGKDTVLRKP